MLPQDSNGNSDPFSRKFYQKIFLFAVTTVDEYAGLGEQFDCECYDLFYHDCYKLPFFKFT